MSPVIEVAGVWKRYGRQVLGIKEFLVQRRALQQTVYSREWALRDVSFSVERGAAFGVVGHNGTGKSTLLSLLLGTIFPDQGSVRVEGKVASMLELGAGFHPALSGRENIFLYGAILGMSIAEITARLDAIIEFSELGAAVDNPIRTYSNGMVARLGFATIAHAPVDILLIDEVLAVGDTRFKQKCRQHLLDFKARGGTLVIVSHELDVLRDMCEVGMCLHLGEVAAHGQIEEVLSHYQALMRERPDLQLEAPA